MKQRGLLLPAVSAAMIIAALLFLLPFYFVLVNSVKPYGEILKSAAALPSKISLTNYGEAFDRVSFMRVLGNSLLVTTLSIAGLVVLGSAAAWRLVRRRTRITRTIFFLFVASMVVPFQSIMIPLMRVISTLGWSNSRIGLVLIYYGFSLPFTVFLYHGFALSIPREIEESAMFDGCTPVQTFTHIVFPLLRSMTVTVIILQTLLIWNDFLLPLLVLNDRELHTVPLAVFSFFGQYTNRWDYALAVLVLGMIPVIVFFLILQKYIVRGVSDAAVKG